MSIKVGTIDKMPIYLWEVIFILFITGYFGISFIEFPEFDYEAIWEAVFPIVFGVNILGIIFAVFLQMKLKDTRDKIKAIDSDGKKKMDDMFLWLNDVPKKNTAWERIEKLAQSGNQSDWRVAILEADSMLDELTKKLGYDGDSIGERLMKMNSNNFPYLEEAWRVHKLRNIVAHETSYDLQRGEMEDAIDAYSLIFKTNGII